LPDPTESKRRLRHGRHLAAFGAAFLAMLALSACSGGSDDGGSVANRAPTANAGTSLTVVELTVVLLNGTGSDADGDPLTYAWAQTAGPVVTLSNANMAQASFTAPDVAAGTPELLTFRLTATDPDGLTGSSTVNITVQEPAAAVTISGSVHYEFPPPNSSPVCDGLNFAAVQTRPIRRASVQILQSPGNTVLGSMVSSDTGAYSFVVPGQTDVRLRVRAELKQGGAQSWDVEVRDNTQSTNLPLTERPLYVLDGAVFNSGGVDSTRNLTATTGWGVNSYTGPRAAAPFAILDTIYSVTRFIAAEDPTADFPPLDAYWSVNNNTSDGTGDFFADIDNGDIGTSFYLGGSFSGLFLLGMEGDDTEEFDDHVIAHEWGHYFEDKFSRSDSIGGSHSSNDRLDARVAFGEGWATALSGIALNNPNYCDTLWSGGNLTGFRIDIEGWNTGAAAGWYNEFSILKIIYDLWDANTDGSDNDSIGFGPIYDVMTGPQASTPAFTSIFTFAEALKNQGTGQNTFIDSQLTREVITAAGIEAYASTETNNAGGAQDVLPVYTSIPTNGSIVNVCSNSQFDRSNGNLNATGNKLSEHRFLRMNVTTQGQYTFTILTDAATLALLPPDDPNDVSDQSDPDIYMYRNGVLVDEGTSGVANEEIFTTPSLAVGNYVMDFHEFRYEDTDTPAGFPARACFTIQITGP
jgi:hypothetical protein